MSQSRGTLESLALGLANLLTPLEERLQAGSVRLLFAELGQTFPPELDAQAGLQQALTRTITHIEELPGLIESLNAAIQAEDIGTIIQKSLSLVNKVKAVIEDFDVIASALQSIGGAINGVSAGQMSTFAANLPGRLVEYLIVEYVEDIPGLAQGLELIQTIERTTVTDGDLTFVERRLHMDNFIDFLTNPVAHLGTLYQWSQQSFDGQLLLNQLHRLITEQGIAAVLDTGANPDILDVVSFELQADNSVSPPGLKILINEDQNLQNAETIEGVGYMVEFITNFGFGAGTEITIHSDGKATLSPPSGQVQGDHLVRVTARNDDGTPYVMLGQAGGSRLEVADFIGTLKAGLAWDNTENEAKGIVSVTGEFKGGKVVIDLSSADGFIGDILGGLGIEADFDVGMGFSSEEGIFFFGSSGLEVQLPLHVNLGLVEINALTLSTGLGVEGIPVGLGTNIKANFGPLKGVIEQIGLKADFSFPDNQNGNLGLIDFNLGFQPPKGIGLSINAGVVIGGGYLFFDFEKEEYAGALELTLGGFISLKAIGLITTRLPDGSKGFSMLLVLTAEFGTGLQLGFGFTLLGVGGIIGLHRTMKLDALAQGIRDGSIESVMFPTNVVENAPRIISDLRAFFPPERDKFLIGPMLKIGWGTPTLISLSMGLIIEIRTDSGGGMEKIAIVGVLKMALPDENAALLVLQVNFIGAVDFPGEYGFFFASLFGSRVLFLTIEGEMGVLIAWGQNANFVVSAGGFHPQFSPPPLPFPNPKRIAINVLNESWGRIRVMGYFATTSNTVQFGCRAELFFGFSEFKIEGHFSFDALMQFDPFYFIIEMSFSVSLKVFGIGLFSISLKLSLEGPTPWRAKGTGKLKLLFFTIKANFDFTWGEERDTTLPPIEVMPLLAEEFSKRENWTAQLPAGNQLGVSLGKLPEGLEDLVLHPVGTLEVRQRAVPLEIPLAKFGNQRPSDYNEFDLTVLDSDLGELKEVEEPFAMSQFQDLKDADKLSRPAFESQTAGMVLSVTGEQLRGGSVIKRRVRYELITIDTNYKRNLRRFFSVFKRLFNHFLGGNAAAKSVLSKATLLQTQPFAEKIEIVPGTFTVAFNSNNTPMSAASASFSSQAKAQAFMQQQMAASPELEGSLHVIPHFEVNTAA